MSLKMDQASSGVTARGHDPEVGTADRRIGGAEALPESEPANGRSSPWLFRAIRSNLRLVRIHRTVYVFAGLAVALSALAAGSIGATLATLPIGLMVAVFAAAANETPTRRVVATFMPRRGQMLSGQMATAFLLVTGAFFVCAIVAAPITAAISTAGLAAVLGSYGMSYVATLLLSALMFFTTLLTRSAPATFGLIASGVVGVLAAAIAGSEALLALVPISATVIVGTGLAGLTVPALVALLLWIVVVAVIAVRRFRRTDFGG